MSTDAENHVSVAEAKNETVSDQAVKPLMHRPPPASSTDGNDEGITSAKTSPSASSSLLGSPPSKTQNPATADLWVETKTTDGKLYYYHAITRETTWTRPEGSNVNIMTQDEVEVLNKQQSQQSTIDQQGVDVVPVTTVVPAANTTAATIPLQQSAIHPPRFTGPPPTFGMAPFGMPPPNFSNFPPWNPPAVNNGQAWMMGQNHPLDVTKQAMSEIKLNEIDPAIVAKAKVWSEHSAPDGRTFYYNALKGESVWEKPQALRDLEKAKLAVWSIKQKAKVNSSGPPFLAPPIPPQMPIMSSIQTSTTGIKIQQFPSALTPSGHGISGIRLQQLPVGTSSSVIFDPLGFMAKNDKSVAEEERKRKAEQEKKRKEEEESVKVMKPQDKSRPIYHNPISGTPWCVVWTGDGRVFFYNPSSRTSVWERPEELKDRADVDKAVLVPPPELLGTAAATKETDSVSSKGPTIAPGAAVVTTIAERDDVSLTANNSKNVNDTRKMATETTDSSGEENGDHASKRLKIEVDAALKSTQNATRSSNELEKEVIAMEAEARAARERTLIPLDVRMKSFREMLREKDVSAFST